MASFRFSKAWAKIKKKRMKELREDFIKEHGKEAWNKFKMEQWKDRARQMAQRRKTLTAWYTPDECMKYWEAIGKKDWKALKKLHKKHVGDIMCPACQVLSIKEKL